MNRHVVLGDWVSRTDTQYQGIGCHELTRIIRGSGVTNRHVVLGDRVSRTDKQNLGIGCHEPTRRIRGSECHVPTPGIKGLGVTNRHVVVGDRSVTFRHQDNKENESLGDRSVMTCLVVLNIRFYFLKNRLRRRTPRRTVMGTTDRRMVSFQNTQKILNWVLKIDSLNFVKEWQDGP